jgi:zinc transport system substrate-binding protein
MEMEWDLCFRWVGVVLLILAALATACGGAPTATAGGPLQVTVSIVPQVYFVERIGGEYVSVTPMVLPGDNPETYEPKPEQLKVLSRSAAYFSIGVPFEGVWLDRIASANPGIKMVDTIAGIERMPMTTPEPGQPAGAPDPHVWLSPRLVKVQAQTIYEALVELAPEHEAAFKANLDALIGDIDGLESDIRQTLSGVTQRDFIVFHPSWGYFARDFGLQQIPIEVGGREPSAQELAQLIETAQAEGIHVVFAAPEFSTASAESIARAIDGQVLLISPLAADWLANMQRVAQTFAEALSQGGS